MSSAPTFEKQKLSTESDHILKEFRQDIVELNKRVLQLESERKVWQKMVEKNKIIQDHLDYSNIQNTQINSGIVEDFKVIDNIFDNLKDPVEKVVDNLSQVCDEISDKELQNSLLDCLVTAENIKKSFESSSSSIKEFSQEFNEDYKFIDIRSYLKEFLTLKQSDKYNLRLLVDQTVPKNLEIKEELLYMVINSVLNNLTNNLIEGTDITITTSKKPDSHIESKVGLGIYINITANQPSNINWLGSFDKSVGTEKTNNNIPLEWVARRNNLRRFNGDLIVLSENNKVIGVNIKLPQKYNLA